MSSQFTTPVVTEMQVIPVAGHDSMLMNLSGAHAPFFTRNIVIIKDNSGHTGVGEVPGGEKIRKTLEDAIPLVVGRTLDVHTIAELARQSCKRVYECESAEHAIELALEHAKMNDCILICGSLYLIGECEKILRGRPKATD